MAEKTIPILPCPSVPDVVAFYTVLGFETTHLQKSPNPYAALQLGDDLELHFFGNKSVVPAESWSTCVVRTDRVDDLHRVFRERLKAAHGRIPTRGVPRIGQLKDTSYGTRQFLLTDPGGNCIRFAQPTGGSFHHSPPPEEAFARALHNAWLLGVSKGDAKKGAAILDHALSRGKPTSTVEYVRALVLRAELADQLADTALAIRMLAEAERSEPTLGPAERRALGDDLSRAADLREALAP